MTERVDFPNGFIVKAKCANFEEGHPWCNSCDIFGVMDKQCTGFKPWNSVSKIDITFTGKCQEDIICDHLDKSTRKCNSEEYCHGWERKNERKISSVTVKRFEFEGGWMEMATAIKLKRAGFQEGDILEVVVFQ